METNDHIREIALGGGCHWCAEAVFQALRGVREVEQGWIASVADADSFSEGVIVRYDPGEITLATLIEIHLHTHRSTSAHSMRGKYRSAIYFVRAEDEADSVRILKSLEATFPAPVITRVLPFRAFQPSREEITDYYLKNPAKPFCVTYIEPKLQLLREKFSASLQPHRAEQGQSCPAHTYIVS